MPDCQSTTTFHITWTCQYNSTPPFFTQRFSLFLPSFFIFLILNIFFFVGFVVRYWMMMTWCFGATSLLTWPLSVKHQTCAKLSDVHSTYRLTSVFSNHTMASSMIFFFKQKKNSTHYHNSILSVDFMPVIASKRDRWVIVVISTRQRY